MGALALAAGLVGTQPVWAQFGRRAPAQPVPTSPIVSLLSLGRSPSGTFTPTAAPGGDPPLGRPPVSQPIPGPTINN